MLGVGRKPMKPHTQFKSVPHPSASTPSTKILVRDAAITFAVLKRSYRSVATTSPYSHASSLLIPRYVGSMTAPSPTFTDGGRIKRQFDEEGLPCAHFCHCLIILLSFG